MAKTTYNISLRSETGTRVDTMSEFLELKYSLKLNKYGNMTLLMPYNYDIDNLGPYKRLRVYRDGKDQKLVGDTDWFVTGYGYTRDSDGSKKFIIIANTALWFFTTGPVARYNIGVTGSSISGNADDAIKDAIRYNGGASTTDSSRKVSASYFDVDSNASAAGSINAKTISDRKIGDVIKEVADAEDVYYDVVWTGSILRFKTWYQLRGTDKSAYIKFSEARANFELTNLIYDYSNEATIAYGFGSGAAGSKTVKSTTSSRHTIGIFARLREKAVNTNLHVPSEVQVEADMAVAQFKPVTLLEGNLKNTPTQEWMDDFELGDKVTVEVEDITATPIIDDVVVTYKDHKEDVRCSIKERF